MATRIVRISAMTAQAQATSLDVHDVTAEVMGYLAFSRARSSYELAAESTDRALKKAQELLEQLRALRSALDPCQVNRGLEPGSANARTNGRPHA
jgi:hypothetical protein